jgi:hypothetical protein
MFMGQPIPNVLWLGLATAEFAVEPTLASLSAAEPKDAPGYDRMTLKPTDWTIRQNPLRADSNAVVFRNIGEERWPSVRTWFLTTGQDGNGVVLASGRLRVTRVLMPGDTLELPVSFSFEPLEG